jgi:hypothetical protein
VKFWHIKIGKLLNMANEIRFTSCLRLATLGSTNIDADGEEAIIFTLYQIFGCGQHEAE